MTHTRNGTARRVAKWQISFPAGMRPIINGERAAKFKADSGQVIGIDTVFMAYTNSGRRIAATTPSACVPLHNRIEEYRCFGKRI